MTAEIAVMNCEAVALAADSAVTMTTERGPKVYQSANKIFGLSRLGPVALMVYDNAKFLGVPWETVAKTYREQRGVHSFRTLAEHAEDFLDFIQESTLLFPPDARSTCADLTINRLFSAIRDFIDDRIEEKLGAEGEITDADVTAIVGAVIREVEDLFAGAEVMPSAPTAKSLKAGLKSNITNARDEAFESLPLSPTDKRRLTSIAAAAFVKDMELPIRAPNRSGVVIAGFGAEEIYPSVFEVVIEALVETTLKRTNGHLTTIRPGDTDSVIIPFAQREIVDAFIGGIDPGFQDLIGEYWQDAFKTLEDELVQEIGATGTAAAQLRKAVRQRCTTLLKEHGHEVQQRRREQYALPILEAVSMLPKDELGAMAESLVNLTSFKRKVSIEAETVGGPIDVAVISKGDGLIWIKRKHYFDSRLNPQYFASRYGGRPDGQEDS